VALPGMACPSTFNFAGTFVDNTEALTGTQEFGGGPSQGAHGRRSVTVLLAAVPPSSHGEEPANSDNIVETATSTQRLKRQPFTWRETMREYSCTVNH
jgi:hypothetical protein